MLEDTPPTSKLALVVSHGLNRLGVGVGKGFADLLRGERVVARQWLGGTHVAQLVEHGRPGSMRPLIGLDLAQLDLRELMKPCGDRPAIEAVVARKRKLVFA